MSGFANNCNFVFLRDSLMKVISILGSTGSIGQSTLDVIDLNKNKFKIFGLSCFENLQILFEQCKKFNPNYAVCKNEKDADELISLLRNSSINTEVIFGHKGYSFIASTPSVTHVVASISGSSGLHSTFEAAKKGKNILLANKESMVMAGSLLLKEVTKNGGQIIPVDSEHNAIFQILNQNDTAHQNIKKIILTASGGPFLNYDKDLLKGVTVSEALNHPNWIMGKKITIDSATMMNKVLELIEAHYLFNLSKEKLDVIIHPESIIHSMVEYIDGSIIAQMGYPDMNIPISYCLAYPEKRIMSGLNGLDFSQVKSLNFLKPNFEIFPCLKLAHEIIGKDQFYSIVMNAANECAVNNFLKLKIKFTHIYEVICSILNSQKIRNFDSVEDIIEINNEVLIFTQEFINKKF